MYLLRVAATPDSYYTWHVRKEKEIKIRKSKSGADYSKVRIMIREVWTMDLQPVILPARHQYSRILSPTVKQCHFVKIIHLSYAFYISLSTHFHFLIIKLLIVFKSSRNMDRVALKMH